MRSIHRPNSTPTGRRCCAVLLWLVCTPVLPQCAASAQAVAAEAIPRSTVSLHIAIEPDPKSPRPSHHAMPMSPAPVIAWLEPVDGGHAPTDHPAVPGRTFLLTQKNKQFSPHVLVVPTGSSVEFPNLDPFFHNVFSLYNGRRFDLGLYEAGSRRSVRFDHVGVSYIFCNIHPEMAAVILSLDTPYYATANPDGSVLLLNVPTGDYDLHLWSENASSADLQAAGRRLHIAGPNVTIPAILVRRSSSVLDRHLDKFGQEYKKTDQTPY